jgi:hypothetical protein
MRKSWLLMTAELLWRARQKIPFSTGDSIRCSAIAQRCFEVKRARGRLFEAGSCTLLINRRGQGFAKPGELGISFDHG